MKMLKFLFPALLLLFTASFSGDKSAYKIFTANGKQTDYAEMLKQAAKADVVFFGEQHNNSIAHWMELELTKDLYNEKKEKLVLGAEMFEADNQLVLDEYLKGYIKQSAFKEGARLWTNYATDYNPLVEFAKEKHLQFIASNVPRRYASMVGSKGLNWLDSNIAQEARQWVAPLPIYYNPDQKCYKDMLAMMGGSDHSSPNIPKAQALKDATMAYFISKNYTPGKIILHYNGAYHSNNKDGIVSYLLRSNPHLKIVTISVAEQEKTDDLEKDNQNIADFIICVPDDMTKTY